MFFKSIVCRFSIRLALTNTAAMPKKKLENQKEKREMRRGKLHFFTVGTRKIAKKVILGGKRSVPQNFQWEFLDALASLGSMLESQ